ncbi:uncharacterized protein LOC115245247 isoform X2 [Formica exsecta]|uniref:uncharacterized protein LOC115245247 isoform X2 n=1 Tax=Formica exsecta TaxID=72781 RepID=UPI001144FEFD|nr:uncharacterized protein LOC115245247 isoform X2 [Formica exsecta]
MQRVIQFLWINVLLQMIEVCSKYALTKTAKLADSLYIADRKAREAVQLRKKWKKDFGGGGASPEIHIAQDSLGMGIKHKEITTDGILQSLGLNILLQMIDVCRKYKKLKKTLQN